MQHVCTMYVQHSLFSRILNLRFKHADQAHTEALYMYIYETMYVCVTEQCVIWKTKSLRSRGMKMAEGGLESRWLRGLFFGSIYICVLCGGAGSLTERGTRLHTHTHTHTCRGALHVQRRRRAREATGRKQKRKQKQEQNLGFLLYPEGNHLPVLPVVVWLRICLN